MSSQGLYNNCPGAFNHVSRHKKKANILVFCNNRENSVYWSRPGEIDEPSGTATKWTL